MDVLETAYAQADENGYHVSVFYNPVAVFELMADIRTAGLGFPCGYSGKRCD